MSGFLTLARRINLRHFREKRLRTLLTVGGVASGVMLVFSIGVINATLLESVRSSVRTLAGAAEIEVATADRNGIPDDLTRQVAGLEGVQRAVPVLRATASVENAERTASPMIFGITPDFGSLFPSSGGEFGRVSIVGGFGGAGGGLLVADDVAEALGARVGDRISIETPSGPKRVPITGRISGSAVDFLNGGRIGMMLLPAAQEIFDRPGRIDSIYVVTDRTAEVADVEDRITAALDVPVIVGPPGERGEGFEEQVGSIAALTSLAGTVALLVSIFVVFNTMSMSLAERRREISMALALGASARQMFAAFLTEAALIGAVASAVGIQAGYLLAKVLIGPVVEGLTILPISQSNAVVVPLLQLVLAAVGGLVVAVCGAYVPARRVLKVGAVEALRPDAAYDWEASRRPSFRATALAALAAGGAAAAIAVVYVFLFNEQHWLVNISLGFGLLAISSLLVRAVPFGVDRLRAPFVRFFGPLGRLSIDALAKNTGRTTFTVAALILTLGMTIGVASALGSYEKELERSAGQWLGADLYVTAKSYRALGADQPLAADTQRALQGVDGIEGIYPVRYGFITVRGAQMMIYAVPAARAAKEGFGVISGVNGIPQDELIEGVSEGNVYIARLTAEEQGWDKGDVVTLPTPSGGRKFTVGGVFEDLNSFQSMLLEHEVYSRAWDDHKIDRLGVVIEEGAEVGRVQRDLQTVIEREQIPARVLTREESVGQLVATIEGLFQIARGIQFAALVVALLTIANTMFTAVLERRWEMGLQRAIGMGTGQIGRGLFLETLGIGILGGTGAIVMGTVIGFFMTRLMEAQYAWRIPYSAPLGLIAVAVLAGIAIAVVAGLLPTRMAVRSPIIESLRYE